MSAKKFPARPQHPERVCWGCDRYCPAQAMMCGNGSVRTPHPVEMFGDDWQEWADGVPPDPTAAPPAPVIRLVVETVAG